MPPTNPSTLNPNPSAAALPYNSALSLWLSVDPLSDKYPGSSPYVYCANNLVQLVDKDGREIWIVGSEDERNSAFYDMQNGTNLSLSMDENGLISASGGTVNGERLTRADKKLLKAINDQNVTANICVSPFNNENSAGGAYMGTEYDPRTETATSCNSVNLDKLHLSEQKFGARSGSGIIHEATEGYQSGLISIKHKTDIMPASGRIITVSNIVTNEQRVPDFMSPSGYKIITTKVTTTTNEFVPDYPKDYKFFKQAHNRATPQPGEYKF